MSRTRCSCWPDVHADVVAGGLAPVDVGRCGRSKCVPLDFTMSRLRAAAPPARRAAARRAPGGRSAFARRLREVLAGVAQRRAEAIGAERLQQVVERVDLERAQRVLVVGGDEHDGRLAVRLDRARARSRPVTSGIWMSRNRRSRLPCSMAARASSPVAHSPHQLDVGLGAEQRHDARPRDRLVVDDQRPDLLAHAAPAFTGSATLAPSTHERNRDGDAESVSSFENANACSTAIEVLEPRTGVGRARPPG